MLIDLFSLQLQQKVMTTAVVASMLVNVGTVLSVSAMTFAASASFAAAGFSGVGVLANWIKVCSFEMERPSRDAQCLSFPGLLKPALLRIRASS